MTNGQNIPGTDFDKESKTYSGVGAILRISKVQFFRHVSIEIPMFSRGNANWYPTVEGIENCRKLQTKTSEKCKFRYTPN